MTTSTIEIDSGRPRPAPAPTNPYASSASVNNATLLPKYHPLTLIKRAIYVGISLTGLLRHFNVYNVILQSPHIRREWFKVGLALTIAILGIKAYLELYEGYVKKSEVNYKNFRQTTHLSMILIVSSLMAFTVALWPHYGWNTLFVLGLTLMGVILQLMLMVPSYVQNIASFVALTFFLQQYA